MDSLLAEILAAASIPGFPNSIDFEGRINYYFEYPATTYS